MKKRKILAFCSLVLAVFPAFSSAADWNLLGVDIITRAQRGADETIRFLPRSKEAIAKERAEKDAAAMEALRKSDPAAYDKKIQERAEAAKIENAKADYMKKNFPNEWSYDSSRATLNGKYLLREDQIKNKKTKIIVHHTADRYDPNRTQTDAMKEIQRIYKYHTINRDFGDIGYNFLIDHLGNIYEGRAGGEGAVGMHASYNNIASVGISLLGNFEEQDPTEAQLLALTNLLTAISRKYNIDPTQKAYYHKATSAAPYIASTQNYAIAGHKDAGTTACPGKNLYALFPAIRAEVSYRLKNGVVGMGDSSFLKGGFVTNPSEVSAGREEVPEVKTENTTYVPSTGIGRAIIEMVEKNQSKIQILIDKLRARYMRKNPSMSFATTKMNKIAYQIPLEEAKTLLNQNISVLLYELSTKYSDFSLVCDGRCIVTLDGNEYILQNPSLSLKSDKIQLKVGTTLTVEGKDLSVVSQNGGPVTIANYSRKSYANIPWNSFRGSLRFVKSKMKDVNGKEQNQFIVINTLPFQDYLKGIVESNDQDHYQKNKVMALISKSYALFYMVKQNQHPSVPTDALYTAIDSPEMFQKYVGAGAEKTLKNRPKALAETKTQLAIYNGYVPILPYFNCSVGFTRSAQEKRGWQDTPYLKSRFDFITCSDFNGHGVGLAGQGAQYLAEKGFMYDDLLEYYYPGVKIVNI